MIVARLLRPACLLLLFWGTLVGAQVPVPALRSPVTDLTSTLTAQQRESLDATLRAFEARKGSQVAVLIVPTTQPETIEQFGIRVADKWKLGRKKIDDGAILIIAKDDRTLRIEVGYGLEGVLTDAASKRIISEVVVPRLRQGDFDAGVRDGVNSIMRIVDGETLPPPSRAGGAETTEFREFLPGVLLIAFGLGRALRGFAGRIGRRPARHCRSARVGNGGRVWLRRLGRRWRWRFRWRRRWIRRGRCLRAVVARGHRANRPTSHDRFLADAPGVFARHAAIH